MNKSECRDDEKDCRYEQDKAVADCKAQIPTAEANAKIKSLFGYPLNRYIINNQTNNNDGKNPNRCLDYLSILTTIASEYQACQYAKKNISKAQEKKVRAHMSSIGMYPPGKLDTHLRNRQSDEGRWLICNYIVACEQGITFLGQETNSLCK